MFGTFEHLRKFDNNNFLKTSIIYQITQTLNRIKTNVIAVKWPSTQQTDEIKSVKKTHEVCKDMKNENKG